MRSTIKVTRKLLVCAALIAWIASGSAQAVTVNYTVDGWTDQFPAPTTPPANAPWGVNGYPGDTVEFGSENDTTGAFNGTLDLSIASQILPINSLLWVIDYTYGGTATDPNNWSDLTFNFTALRNMSIDGSPVQSISQNGQLDVTWDNDFISLSGGSTISFIVQGYQVNVTPLALAQTGGSNFSGSNPWTQPGQDVMAQFDVTVVPEPISMIMLGCMGAGMLGARVIRRKKN